MNHQNDSLGIVCTQELISIDGGHIDRSRRRYDTLKKTLTFVV